MKFLTRSNVIPMLQGVVDAIQPYALSNQVNLKFNPGIKELIIEYHPEWIINDITQLLCNIIAFTPQTYGIEVSVNELNEKEMTFLEVRFKNDGVDLARISKITELIKNDVKVTSLKPNGTLFHLYLLQNKQERQVINSRTVHKTDHHGIP